MLLERVTRVAPLGIRFWDEVSGAFIRDGLNVNAYPAANPALNTPAIVTPSGVYAFIHLPGLREFEIGRGDQEVWSKYSFIVQVKDAQNRFQAFQFTAHVPACGVYAFECASPPFSPPSSAQANVPLFSSPARLAPGAMAVLRADLWDAVAGVPAAYAMAEVEFDGKTLARGFADRQGRVAIIFAYPEPPGFTLASPLSGQHTLSKQTWTIQLRAFYSPIVPVPTLPDLCAVLNQNETSLFENVSPLTDLFETTLEFGNELILKSQSQSVLWIAPA